MGQLAIQGQSRPRGNGRQAIQGNQAGQTTIGQPPTPTETEGRQNGTISEVAPGPVTDWINLEERLAYWQRQLRLEDWDIFVSWGNAADMGARAGETSVLRSLKRGKVKIISPDEWGAPSEMIGGYDSEATLVHELIHFHLDRWRGNAENDTSSAEYEIKEIAIEALSVALVNLSRGTPR